MNYVKKLLLIPLLSVLVLFSGPAYSLSWSEQSHEVFFIDSDGDGEFEDLLFEATARKMEVPYRILIEVSSDAQSFILEKQEDGSYVLKMLPRGEQYSGEKQGIEGSLDVAARDVTGNGTVDFVLNKTTGPSETLVLKPGENGGDPVIHEHYRVGETTTPERAHSFVRSFPEEASLVGTTGGKFSVSSTGAATYSIPLDAPAGLNGHQPNLQLVYNSRTGNGVLGKGWSLAGIPLIQRCSSTPAHGEGEFNGVTLTNSDRLCMGGRRLILTTDGDYWADGAVYRTEQDSQQIITRVGDSFEIRDNVGGVRIFDQIRPELWAITSWENKFGQLMLFSYLADMNKSQGVLPDEITYGTAKVKFQFAPGRNDTLDKYLGGESRSLDHYLRKIRLTRAGQKLRDYELHYDYEGSSGDLFLKYAQHCGYESGGGSRKCSLPLEIEYSNKSNILHEKTSPMASKDYGHKGVEGRPSIYDWNGDGINDFIAPVFGTGLVAYYGSSTGDGYYRTLARNYGNDFVTPYVSSSGERGIVYLDGEVIQESWEETELVEPGYYKTIAEAESKPVGQCKQTLKCKGDGAYWDGPTCWNGRVEPEISYYYLKDNTPDEYDRKWVGLHCDLPDGFKTTKYGSAIGYYQEVVEYVDPVYETKTIIPDYKSFKYSWKKKVFGTNGDIEIKVIASGRICLGKDQDFDVETEFYRPLVGDFNGNGDTDIFVGRPTCSSVDAKEIAWIPAINTDELESRPDFDVLKSIPFSFDGRRKNQIAERKDGGFKIREIDSDAVSNMQTESGIPIPSDWSVLVDVNADGLSDVVSFGLGAVGGTRNKNNIYIFINQGGSYKDPVTLDYSNIPGASSSLSQILDLSRSYESPVSDRIRIFDYDKNGTFDLLIVNGSSPEDQDYANSLITLRTVVGNDKQPVFEFIDLNIKSEHSTDLTHKVVVYDTDGDARSEILVAVNNEYRIDDYMVYGPSRGVGPVAKSFITRYPSGEERTTKVDYSRLNDSEVYDFDWVREQDVQTFASPLSVVKTAYLPVISSFMDGTVYQEGPVWDAIEYNYYDAKFHMKGRGFLGFESYTAESSLRNRKTTFEFYGTGASEEDSFFPEFPYIGKLVRKTVENTASGNNLSVTANVWSSQSLPENERVKRPYLRQSFSQEYDPEGGVIGAKRVSTTPDAYGNLDQRVTQVGEGVDDPHLCLEPDSCVLMQPQWETTENYKHTPTLPTFLELHEISSVSHYFSGPASETLTTTFSFEPHEALPNVVGKKVTSWDAEGQSDKVEVFKYSLNAGEEGQLRSASVESGSSVPELNRIDKRETVYQNYLFGVFPGEIINSEEQKEIVEIDTRSGQPTQIRDVDGLVSNFQYDPLGRVVSKAFPEGYTGNIKYEFCDDGHCPDFAENAVLRVLETGNDNSEFIQYIDAYSRQVATEDKAFDGEAIITTTAYDDRGRISQKSEPYKQGNIKKYTYYDYSDTKDLLTITRPDLSTKSVHTTSFFGPFKVIEIVDSMYRDIKGDSGEVDDRSINRLELVDLNGNTILVSEGGTEEKAVETVFFYDARGRLAGIKLQKDRNESLVTLISYDDAAQTKTLEDPDTGVTITKYNTAGEVVEEVRKGLDATSGQDKIFSFEYDRLGRQVQVSEASSGILGQWFYDQDSEGRSCGSGRLCEKSGPLFEENYIYKNRSGLISSIETKLRSEPDSEPRVYNFSYDYDHTGQEKTVRYPSGFAIERGYQNGYLATITDISSGNGAKELWQAEDYDGRGQIKRSTLGNGLTVNRNYDEVGRLKGLTAGLSESTNDLLQSKAYGYDSLGNLTYRDDKLNSFSESFYYDGLNRLSTQEVTSASGTTESIYEYDPFGNLTSKPGVGSYVYSSYTSENACNGSGEYAAPGPHAVRQAGGNVYCYDEFGNQIRGAGRNIKYGVIGKPVEISQGGDSVQFLYGPDESRFYQKKQANGQVLETFYIAGGTFEEEITDGKSSFKSYLDGFLIDKRGDGGASQSYVLRDHLGSVDTVVDGDVSDGLQDSILETMAYAPFGERLLDERVNSTVNPVSDDRGFTDHEHFDEFGLIHMNGRVYDPVIGRFLSPDPIVQDLYSSQSYNRYSYVWNNPLSATDPSGYAAIVLADQQMAQQFEADTISQQFFQDSANWERTSGGQYQYQDLAVNYNEPAARPNYGAIDSHGNVVNLDINSPPGETAQSLANGEPVYASIFTKGVKFVASGFDVAETFAGNVADFGVLANPSATPWARFQAGVSLASELAPVSVRDAKGAFKWVGQYIQDAPLAKQRVNNQDIPLPLKEAEGRAHTVLGSRVGSDGKTYRQSAEFPANTWPKANGKDVPLSEVHWTNHGRGDHANPHQHPFIFDGNGWNRQGGNGLPFSQ